MTTHLQETWKIQNKVTVYSHYMLQLSFKVDKLRFLVGVSISNSQKLVEWLERKVGWYSRPEKQYEPIQHN